MKVAVMGMGSIGSRHAENLLLLGHRVVEYDLYKTSSGLDDVLDCDAAVIATPTRTHRALHSEFFGTNIPIFMEKPIFDQPGSIRNIVMVGYNLRFHECVKWAKERVSLIGTPLTALFYCLQHNDRPDYMRDGVVLNWSHEIDLALYLLGPADLDGCYGDQIDAYINVRHDSGLLTNIHLDYTTKPERRGFVIAGVNGVIRCDLIKREITLSVGGSDSQGLVAQDSWSDNYLEEMKAFIERVNGQETIGCTAGEACKVLDICLEANKTL